MAQSDGLFGGFWISSPCGQAVEGQCLTLPSRLLQEIREVTHDRRVGFVVLITGVVARIGPFVQGTAVPDLGLFAATGLRRRLPSLFLAAGTLARAAIR